MLANREGRRLGAGAGLSAAVVTLLAAQMIVILAVGPAPQRLFGHDVFVLLDGAWRLQHHIIPSVDYYSAVGVLYFLPMSWAFDATGPNARALPLYHVFWFLMLVLPTAAIALTRRNVHWTDALALFLIALRVTSLRHLSMSFRDSSYAMMYNSFGIAAAAAVLLLLVQDLRSREQWRSFDSTPATGWMAWFVAGLLASLSLLTKASNGVLCLAVIGSGWLLAREGRRFLAAAGGVLLPLALVSAWSPGYLSASASDLRIATGASHYFSAANAMALLTRTSTDPVVYAYFLLLFVLFSRDRTLVVWSAACAVIITAAISMTHYIVPSRVMSAPAECIILAVMLAAVLPSGTVVRTRLALLLLAIVAARPLLQETLSIYDGARFRGDAAARGFSELGPAPLRGLFFPKNGGDPETEDGYAAKLAEALQIVRMLPGNACYVNLDFSDPTSFLLRRNPCRGPTVWHADNSFSVTSHPSASRVFDGSSFALLPKVHGDASGRCIPALMKVYGERLSPPVLNGRYWTVLRITTTAGRS